MREELHMAKRKHFEVTGMFSKLIVVMVSQVYKSVKTCKNKTKLVNCTLNTSRLWYVNYASVKLLKYIC